MKKHYAMWTTIGDRTKASFREDIKPLVDSKFHYAIDQGACDYLYACTHLEPHDVMRAIEESEIK